MHIVCATLCVSVVCTGVCTAVHGVCVYYNVRCVLYVSVFITQKTDTSQIITFSFILEEIIHLLGCPVVSTDLVQQEGRDGGLLWKTASEKK